MESRIVDLEVKVAYLEHTLAQLDEVLQHTLARLEQAERLVRQLGRERDVAAEPGTLEDEVPPHYGGRT